jgi:hypothetical protein
MTPQPDHDAPDHLAERLREARDVANFSHGRQADLTAPSAPGAPGGQVVERVTELKGDAHLGGRKVKDRFVRTGGAPPTPTPPTAAKPQKLDPYLEARLNEIQDQAPRFKSVKPQLADEAVDTYRELRRQLGGQ